MTTHEIKRYTVSGDIAYPIHEDPEGDYVTYEDHVAAIEADRKRRGEPVDKGPWKAGVNRSDKRTFIQSDDFTHDVRLYVDGDFADQDEKLAYALGIADQLNAAPQPAEPVDTDLVQRWQREHGVAMTPGSREAAMVVIRHDEDGKPTVWCDPEIADLVRALNDGGVATVASCSGHGWRPGNIMLADGRVLVVCKDADEAREVTSHFPGINGEATQPAEPIVSDVEAIVRLLESREWAEHVATTPLGQRLETAVTVLVGADQQPAEPASVPVGKAGTVGNAFALIRRLASGEDVEGELRNAIREIAALPAEPVKVPPATAYCQHPHCQTTGGCQGPCSKKQAELVKRKRRYAQGTALGEFGIIPMCDQMDDEPVKVPSDADAKYVQDFINCDGMGAVIVEGPQYSAVVRALLARYGHLTAPTHKSSNQNQLKG